MENIRNYGDFRQRGFCVHCGGPAGTDDHAPSKVLLDEPYPDHLPKVDACANCNAGFSDDEEYVACIIECARVGSAENDEIERLKVRRILDRKPGLREQMRNARLQTDGGIAFNIDRGRIERVVLKLARAHATYELNLPTPYAPSSVRVLPLCAMASDVRDAFEEIDASGAWPEVGSRAMQRAVIFDAAGFDDWIEVQADRYRYHAAGDVGIRVRIVLSEYLAAEVIWDDY